MSGTISISITITTVILYPVANSNFKHFLFVRVWEGARQRDVGGIPHVRGSLGHLTALVARTLAWPQGPNLAEQDPRNLCSENRAHPAVVRQAARRWRRATLAATREEHPFSAGRRRRIQSAYLGTRCQARVPQRSGGSAQHLRKH